MWMKRRTENTCTALTAQPTATQHAERNCPHDASPESRWRKETTQRDQRLRAERETRVLWHYRAPGKGVLDASTAAIVADGGGIRRDTL
jgi:hypothetical protein